MSTIYASPRREMLPFIPPAAKSVLDVGCALGRFGQALIAERPATEVWGIDPVTDSKPEGYSGFWRGAFPAAVPPGVKFDCIVFNDVLEHMVDPWTALRETHDLLAVHGSVVASVPNIRNLRTIVSLVWMNDWRHDETGVHDKTHLRFFTSKTMRELFEGTGFEVAQLEAINLPTKGQRALLRRVTFGLGDPLLAEQFAIRARSR